MPRSWLLMVALVVGCGDADRPSDAGAPVDAGDASVAPPGAPTVLSLEARQAGVFGQDLSLDVRARAGDREIVASEVELLGAGGTLLGTFAVPLTTPIAAEDAARLTVRAALSATSSASSVRVALLDADGKVSLAVTGALERQIVLTEGARCDDALIENRCAEGFGCRGPGAATCQAGVAPTLQRVAYYVDEQGAQLRFEGSDPDRDLVRYVVTFLGESGAPVEVDIDNDATTPAVSSFNARVAAQADTSFFELVTASTVLSEQAWSIRVKLTDAGDLSSAELVAARTTIPRVELGAACDPLGFDGCPPASLCVASMGGSPVCTATSEVQTTACGSAQVLSPSQGITSVRGVLSASRWDPPSGCSFAEPGQRDDVVKLMLTTRAAKLTLSTDLPYTAADTELYLLQSCNETPRLDWCTSDQPEPTSDPQAVLMLTDVSAGEYYVVIDSFPSEELTGTRYELTVEVE